MEHWLWVRLPLEEIKYLLIFIFLFLRSGVKAKTRRWVPPLNTQCLLTLGSLYLTCCVLYSGIQREADLYPYNIIIMKKKKTFLHAYLRKWTWISKIRSIEYKHIYVRIYQATLYKRYFLNFKSSNIKQLTVYRNIKIIKCLQYEETIVFEFCGFGKRVSNICPINFKLLEASKILFQKIDIEKSQLSVCIAFCILIVSSFQCCRSPVRDFSQNKGITLSL